MSKNDFEEFQKQLQKMFGNVNISTPFGFQQGQQKPTEPEEPQAEEEEEDIFEKIRHFNLKPREIRDELDKYVIKQDEAKKSVKKTKKKEVETPKASTPKMMASKSKAKAGSRSG